MAIIAKLEPVTWKKIERNLCQSTQIFFLNKKRKILEKFYANWSGAALNFSGSAIRFSEFKEAATVLPVLDVDLLDLSDQHVEAKSKGPVSSDDLQNAPAAYSKKDWPFSLCLFFITSFST